MYEKPDFYSKKAKEEGYAARSVYKLMEIQDKFTILKKHDKILDLGCAPGSWLQYSSNIIGENGQAVGIDYKSIKIVANNVIIIKGNFLKDNKKEEIKIYSPFDCILSDMAPDTKGDRLTDCYASTELVRHALDFSYEYLKTGGNFVAKIFQGGEENEIMDEMKQAFTQAKWFKPKSCRKKSFEIFLIGIGYKHKPELKNNNSAFDFDNSDGTMPW